MNRMLKRQRSEESAITLDYLHGIHEKHEEWLFSNNASLANLPAAASPSAPTAWTHEGRTLPAALHAQLGGDQSGVLHLRAVEEPPEIRGKVIAATHYLALVMPFLIMASKCMPE